MPANCRFGETIPSPPARDTRGFFRRRWTTCGCVVCLKATVEPVARVLQLCKQVSGQTRLALRTRALASNSSAHPGQMVKSQQAQKTAQCHAELLRPKATFGEEGKVAVSTD